MGDIVAWLPYASAEEAAARLGGLPDGVRVDCYRADGDEHVLAGTKPGAAFMILLKPRAGGGTQVDLMADGG